MKPLVILFLVISFFTTTLCTVYSQQADKDSTKSLLTNKMEKSDIKLIYLKREDRLKSEDAFSLVAPEGQEVVMASISIKWPKKEKKIQIDNNELLLIDTNNGTHKALNIIRAEKAPSDTTEAYSTLVLFYVPKDVPLKIFKVANIEINLEDNKSKQRASKSEK